MYHDYTLAVQCQSGTLRRTSSTHLPWPHAVCMRIVTARIGLLCALSLDSLLERCMLKVLKGFRGQPKQHRLNEAVVPRCRLEEEGCTQRGTYQT